MTTVYTTTVNSNIDLDSYDMFQYFFVDCSAGNVTIDMTTLIYTGYYFVFNRTDYSSNTLTLVPKSGQTIAGGSSYTVPARAYVEVLGVDSDWRCTRFTQQ